jgi:hypothetical protein
MLDQIARHGMIDLKVQAKGDTHIDDHHTVEDVGITLGQAVAKAVGDKKGLRRYGHAYVPLDEDLSRVVIDFSGRPGLVNHVPFTSGMVGGFDTQGVHPHLYNSILWGNSGTVGSVRHQNFAFTANGFDVDYNLIQGYEQAEFLGTGNIGGNPAFVDADGPNNIAGDFDDVLALADTSPAIDAGNNALVGLDWADLDADGILNESAPFDLLMQSRRVDGPVADAGAGGAPVVDMGAFENQHPPCPADFNGDGFLDFFDYDDFVSCYEGNGCPAGKTADYNGDAFVDFFDYDAFVTAFELGC